jgi:hypothetical protein
VADYKAAKKRKKRLLAHFLAIGAPATAGMFFIHSDRVKSSINAGK